MRLERLGYAFTPLPASAPLTAPAVCHHGPMAAGRVLLPGFLGCADPVVSAAAVSVSGYLNSGQRAGLAVVDVETTGFAATDRIVEVAVVRLTPGLEVEGEDVWLVDGRPIPRQARRCSRHHPTRRSRANRCSPRSPALSPPV